MYPGDAPDDNRDDYSGYEDAGRKDGGDAEDDLYVSDGDYGDAESVDIKENDITVASPKAKNVLFLALGGLAVIYVMYNLVFGDKRSEEEILKEEQKKLAESQPIENTAKPPPENVQAEVVTVVEAPEIPDVPETLAEEDRSSDTIPFVDQADLNNQDIFDGLFTDRAEEPEPEPEPEPELQVFEPVRTGNEETAELELEADEPDLPPAAPSAPSGPSAEELRRREETMAEEKERLRTLYGQPFVNSGSSASATPDTVRKAGGYVPDFEYTEPAYRNARQIYATDIGRADTVVAQGKLIEAVLETAINTNLEGHVRAVVSRDIYAETGRHVLIPRGSRLSGTYGSTRLGDTGCRLAIMWTRMILPDGTDINMNDDFKFDGTDQLGRAGICGFVDETYFEAFSAAALISVITVAGAAAAEKISDEETPNISSTSTTAEGTVTQTNNESVTDEAILEGLGRVSGVAGTLIEKILDSGRTIIIPQGTRMRVYVNNDVVFPARNTRVIR